MIDRQVVRGLASGAIRAGVVLDATGLTDPEMLAIAADLGYSETAFLTSPVVSGSVRIRYFAPLQEVPFCGHATIATAVAIAERGSPGEVVLKTNAGPVSVRTRRVDGEIVAELVSVPPTSRPAEPALVEQALAAVRWQTDDLAGSASGWSPASRESG